MKRWQTRGEVQDSDEEELSLEANSHSLEYPSKRIKVDEISASSNQDGDQTRTTPSTLPDHEQLESTAHNDDVTEAENTDNPDVLNTPGSLITREEEDNEPDWTTHTNTKTYGRLQRVPRQDAGKARELFPVVTQAEQNAIDVENMHTVFDMPSSSNPPEDAPAGQQEEVTTTQIARPTTPPMEHSQAADPMSIASSPLSELSNPPDSPPASLRLFASSRIQSQVEQQLPVASQFGEASDIVDRESRTALLTQGARRSLRARQEKQLHPYMYDKAQYQQQCRERGLRPVRLTEQTSHDTQDASLHHDQDPPSSSATRSTSSSSSLGGLLSSAVALDDSFSAEPNQADSFDAEDDLPDMDRLIQSRAVAGRLKSRKRQKFAHPTINRGNVFAHAEHRAELDDVFGVPPSPPDSSRGSVLKTAKAPKGFRLPHGISPKPLPTPQISSDIRPSHGNEATILSDEDTPPRTLRRIARVRSVVTIGSDSTAESESGSEDDQKLLSRERRRIRGVLPASWLNIDRKSRPAQKPASPGLSEHDSTPRAAAQKGVARKIQRRSTAALGLNVLEISDGDEAQASDESTPAITPRMPPPAANNPERAIRPDDDLDVDDMEVDWFDPMLAGASRVRRSPQSNKKRQSRIAGTSRNQSTLDFSQERNGLRHQRGVDPPKQRGAARQAKAKTRQRKSPPHLGILDAPRSPAGHGNVEPQFVRLAARQARQAPNHGRQSPSRKVIRLTTREDTEQANSTLQNWKRGAIPQRPYPETGRSNVVKGRGIAQPSPRTPSADVTDHSHNTMTAHSVPPKLTFNRPQVDATLTQLPPQSKEARRHTTQRLPQHHPRQASTGADTPRRSVQKVPAPQTARYREAQLETHESAYIQQNRSAGFHHRIQCLTEAVARRSSTPTGEVQMRRFLNGPDPVPRAHRNSPRNDEQEQDHAQTRPAQSVSDSARLPHRPRKRRTQRLDVETRQYRQPSEPLPESFAPYILDEAHESDSAVVLRGLGPSGTRYATDFDISRLPRDTYFAESTFIGSGQLASALALDSRTLGHGFGSLRIFISGNGHEWTTWSEEVSTAMAAIPNAISAAIGAVDSESSSQSAESIANVTSNVDHMLHSTIRYLSKCLRFSDSIDSKVCCQQLDQVVQDLLEISEESDRWTSGLQSLRQRILQSALVLARQNQTIGDHVAVPLSIRAVARDRVLRAAFRLASHLVPGYLNELRSAYEEQRMSSARELGIRRDDSPLAGIVILHHCMRGNPNSRLLFWETIEKALSVDPSNTLAAPEIDAVWYSIVTIIPGLDFDSAGIIWTHTTTVPESDWSLPTRLVERCLSLYDATCTVRGSSINEYVRATLARCSHLFTTWRWWKCDTLLSTMYDFFARRNLSLLYREEGKGSPDFLENLTSENISLQVASDDRSFSIYLKLLAASLRTWRHHGVYSDKRIGGIAWRIIPNHARIYPKDSEVRQADLDALRNHFDLLCTLYFASPPTHRLRVDMLRNLVDHATSHREACRISVRAWSRLASFQMSTEESTDKLEPFVEWFKDMTLTTVAQYRFARTEAEQQYAAAKSAGVSGLSDEMLETTIASNQRQIAATLVDLLAAFRRALSSASGADAARVLLDGCEPWRTFDSFDPSKRRLTTVYNEALDMFRAMIDVQRRFEPALDSQDQSEDSQDYGDFSALQEYATAKDADHDTDLVASVQHAFAPMLSNAFGSEVAPDDILLARSLDVWVQSARHLVCKDLRSWGDFVGEHPTGAWSQLRDTMQHRKFTPYVLAKVLEADPEAFDPLKAVFISAWLKCLVERESTLKHQHLLTAALLNVPSGEPILQNLPFSRTSSTAEYRITLPELRQRRLGVISSVFSNMLQHYNTTMFDRPQALPELGRDYAELFRVVMQAMKSNYQDLQLSHSNGTADNTVQGAYVLFVQEVVGFLQQYAIEGICTIDRFFLDSSAFPLPINDPTYVVGKLKKHVSKLAEARTRKQLATFIHNISERAALDQQQPYLTDQMHRAMSGTMESGNLNMPSLRHVLLTSIIPAYLDNAIDDNVTWILALPMIEASRKTVADLLYDTDFESEDGVAAAIEQVGALLNSVQKSLARLATDRQRLSLPYVLKTAAAMLNLCHMSVVFANHVQRVMKQATAVVRELHVLHNQATRIEEQLSTPEDFFDFIADDIEADQPALRWPDTYDFSERQVKQSMVSDWSVVDERYFVKRGNGSREVHVQVEGYAEERDGLLEAIGTFRSICRRQATRGRRSRGADHAFGMDGLMI
jgi:hypothetical protein